MLLVFGGSAPAGTHLYIDGSDVIGSVLYGSLQVKLNTLDCILVDPATVPALDDAVSLSSPSWSGTVASATVADMVDGHVYVTITASNTAVASVTPAPWGLSDAPDGVTTFGYRALTVSRSKNGAGTELRASCETFTEGLVQGMTVELTSATQGLTAEEFTVTDMSVSWPTTDGPVYALQLGDPIATLSAFVDEQAADAVDAVFPIDGTKITDGAITTPKLAANSVDATKIAANTITATEIAAGAITTSELAAGSVTVEKLDIVDEAGNTALSASGFEGTWRDFIRSGGIYNSNFASGSGTDAAVSEVSGGDSAADYAASISSDIPYWVVAASDGTIAAPIADSNAFGGTCVRSTASAGGQVNRIYQDIPLDLGYYQHIGLRYAAQRTSGSYTIKAYLSWRDADHGLLGTRDTAWTLSSSSSSTDYFFKDLYTSDMTDLRPVSSAYIRLELEVTHVSTSGTTVEFALVQIENGVSYPVYLDVQQDGVIEGDFGVNGTSAFNDVVTLNAALVANAAMPMMASVEFSFNGTLGGSSTNNCSVSGAAPASQARGGFVAPYAGSIVGISIIANASRTAGSGYAECYINESIVGLHAQLNASNTFNIYATAARGTYAFAAGARLETAFVTTSWTPTANIITIVLHVVYDAVA